MPSLFVRVEDDGFKLKFSNFRYGDGHPHEEGNAALAQLEYHIYRSQFHAEREKLMTSLARWYTKNIIYTPYR